MLIFRFHFHQLRSISYKKINNSSSISNPTVKKYLLTKKTSEVWKFHKRKALKIALIWWKMAGTIFTAKSGFFKLEIKENKITYYE